MAAACTGVGVENFAAMSSLLQYKERSVILRNFAFCFLAGGARRAHTKCRVSAAMRIASLVLDYAKNVRRKLRRVISEGLLTRGTAQHNRGIKRKNSVAQYLGGLWEFKRCRDGAK